MDWPRRHCPQEQGEDGATRPATRTSDDVGLEEAEDLGTDLRAESPRLEDVQHGEERRELPAEVRALRCLLPDGSDQEADERGQGQVLRLRLGRRRAIRRGEVRQGGRHNVSGHEWPPTHDAIPDCWPVDDVLVVPASHLANAD